MKNYIVSNRSSRLKVTIQRDDECLMGEWVDTFFVKKQRGKKILSVTKFYDGHEARQFANATVFS
jgi:hypothetical protein